MTNRVSCNGVTISDVKSIDGLAVNTLPHRAYANWQERPSPLLPCAIPWRGWHDRLLLSGVLPLAENG
jgi:hypothetical protein